ncbi:MAG: hypothetical protein HQL18_00385 [Candidatus Omnitrophica bacterium]|nr:hypothetical protein [Candidatus Omnitrophota bacterium]
MNILSKLDPDFQSPSNSIEIFCPEEYHGYHVRGQIKHFMDEIHDPTLPDGHANGQYLLAIFILLRNDLPGSGNAIPSNYGRLGTFLGRTIDEFRAIRKKLHEDSLSPRRNHPILIPIKDFNIKETTYLSSAIERNQKIILLKIELCFHKPLRPPRLPPIRTFPKRIYPLLASSFLDTHNQDPFVPAKDKKRLATVVEKIRSNYKTTNSGLISDYGEEDSTNLFPRLYDIVHFNLGYDAIDKEKFLDLLFKIATLSSEWLNNQSFPIKNSLPQYQKKLNALIQTVTNHPDPIYDLCHQFIIDLIADLHKDKLLSLCPKCGYAMRYQWNKKGCALAYDGRNCSHIRRKTNRNRRLGHKERPRRSPKPS